MPKRKKLPKSKRALSDRTRTRQTHRAVRLCSEKEPIPETVQHHYRTVAHSRIEELIRIAENPDGAEDGRDAASARAIRLAFEVVAEFVEWAVEHQIGLAMVQVESAPTPPPGYESDPRYTLARDETNRDVHQMRGTKYAFDKIDINREVLYRLFNLAASVSSSNAARFLKQVGTGFRALNSGELSAHFVPANLRRRAMPFTLDELKRRAAQHVAYRIAAENMTAREAIAKVAQEFGRPTATVSDWYRRGPFRSAIHKTALIDQAVALGEHGGNQKDAGAKGSSQFNIAERLYSDEALQADANAFKAAQGTLTKTVKPRRRSIRGGK